MISFIIPIHNAENFLSRCLDSVIRSLDKNKGEIILINNNSTDNTLNLAHSYQKKYSKLIRVFECRTWGAAAARNLGAKKAKGDYIWFIDADDFIASQAIKKMLELIDKDKPDLIMFGAKRVYPDGHTDYLSPVSPDESNFKSRFVRYGMGPWQVLIRREWWQKYNFNFKEGIIHEDMELMSSLILYTNNLASINKPLYFYIQTPNSVLHQQEFNPHVFDIFPALEGLYKRFENAKMTTEYHSELEWFFIWNLLLDAANDFSKFKEARAGFKRSRTFLKEYFPNWRKNKFLAQKPLKLKLKVIMNYYR